MKRWTQRQTFHLNRNPRFESHWEILHDGEPTGITRHALIEMTTYGDATILADELHFGTDTLDRRKQKDWRAWCRRRLGKEPPR